MAVLSVTNTFVAGTSASAAQVNANFSDIVTWLNNRYNGTDTWSLIKVSSTNANPVDIASSASGTELSLNNTATDGDPLLTFKLSGSQTHAIGVDDSDSDFLKFATTSITTNVAMQVPTVGAQVQFASGTVSLPGVSFIGDSDTGWYLSGSNVISATTNGTIRLSIGNQVLTEDGTNASPYYSFISDPDTGMYRSGGNTLSFSTNATLRVTIGDQLISQDGAVGSPFYSFISDTDTGMYRPGANQVSLTTNGAEVLRVDASATATHTRLLIYDVDNGQVERVTVGAADSGGAGFKLLRIAN